MESDGRQRTIRAIIGLVAPIGITAGLVVVAPPGIYLWLKALHLGSAIAWVGGMLCLTYLLSWHAGMNDPATAKLLLKVEIQLLQSVVNPAMVFTWGIGLWLAWDAGWFMGGWLQAKLVLVLGLSALHGWIVGAIRAMAQGKSERSAKTFWNVTVVGAVVALSVIALAVVKPM